LKLPSQLLWSLLYAASPALYQILVTGHATRSALAYGRSGKTSKQKCPSAQNENGRKRFSLRPFI